MPVIQTHTSDRKGEPMQIARLYNGKRAEVDSPGLSLICGNPRLLFCMWRCGQMMVDAATFLKGPIYLLSTSVLRVIPESR
jgi:hypothetical protein